MCQNPLNCGQTIFVVENVVQNFLSKIIIHCLNLVQNKNLVKKILETNFLGRKKFKIVKILESKKILVEKNVWSKKLQK